MHNFGALRKARGRAGRNFEGRRRAARDPERRHGRDRGRGVLDVFARVRGPDPDAA